MAVVAAAGPGLGLHCVGALRARPSRDSTYRFRSGCCGVAVGEGSWSSPWQQSAARRRVAGGGGSWPRGVSGWGGDIARRLSENERHSKAWFRDEGVTHRTRWMPFTGRALAQPTELTETCRSVRFKQAFLSQALQRRNT